MENPKYIQIEPKQAAAENIGIILLPSRHRNKNATRSSMPYLHYNPYLAIVFTNTKKMAEEVAMV